MGIFGKRLDEKKGTTEFVWLRHNIYRIKKEEKVDRIVGNTKVNLLQLLFIYINVL